MIQVHYVQVEICVESQAIDTLYEEKMKKSPTSLTINHMPPP